MSRFFVGQRVWIVDSLGSDGRIHYCAVLGQEGVVNEIDSESAYGVKGHIGVTVGNSDQWCFLPCNLEPITDANDKVSWESMRDLWIPEHMAAPASLTRSEEVEA